MNFVKNSISPLLKLLNNVTKSPFLEKAGPDVAWILTFFSKEIIFARVVLPNPVDHKVLYDQIFYFNRCVYKSF